MVSEAIFGALGGALLAGFGYFILGVVAEDQRPESVFRLARVVSRFTGILLVVSPVAIGGLVAYFPTFRSRFLFGSIVVAVLAGWLGWAILYATRKHVASAFETGTFYLVKLTASSGRQTAEVIYVLPDEVNGDAAGITALNRFLHDRIRLSRSIPWSQDDEDGEIRNRYEVWEGSAMVGPFTRLELLPT